MRNNSRHIVRDAEGRPCILDRSFLPVAEPQSLEDLFEAADSNREDYARAMKNARLAILIIFGSILVLLSLAGASLLELLVRRPGRVGVMTEEGLVTRNDQEVGRELEVINPAQLVAKGREMANVLAEVIESQDLYTELSGRRHVHVDAWTACAAMLGVVPVEVPELSAVHDDGAYSAVVELINEKTGAIVGRASALCGGPDEENWMVRNGRTVPPNARKSMAITRATGKACRMRFSWIVVLAGFSATPAEEMDAVVVNGSPSPAPAQQTETTNGAPCVPFGRNAGVPVSELDDRQLSWYLTKATDQVENGPEMYRDKERIWLDHLKNEQKLRDDKVPL